MSCTSVNRHAKRAPFVLIILLLVLSACGQTAAPASAVVSAPLANAQFKAGEIVEIQGRVSGSGLRSVDVFVDNTKYSSVSVGGTANELTISTAWVAAQQGVHTILFKGLDDKGNVLIVSDAVIIMVEASTPTPAPPTPKPTPLQEPTIAPTVEPQATATPQTAQATPSETDYVNVRSGPGATYAIVGRLDKGISAPITGKNGDVTWWQISFPSASGGVGWVLAELIAVSGDTSAVQVASAPPPPTAAPIAQAPTAPPAAPPPTAVSNLPAYALQPYSQKMRFSPRDNIGDIPLGMNATERVTVLNWEVYGATKLELDVATSIGPGIYSQCPAGNLFDIQADSAYIAGQRFTIEVPKGLIQFTIPTPGYYLFTIYVTKTDRSTTTIPRAVIVECFKSG